ncbi:MAG TPA: IPT/TIG domain-containing protein, partial [Tepidiformaceae bacterium]|nr:IPT/TIG domain-containing protein [Tepidiformaceae bacterium]
AVTPAHATVGLVNVSVSTGSGVDTDVYAFTYTNQSGPTVTSVSPTSGPAGTTITITGVNLLNTSSVTVGGVAATFNVISSTSVTAVVPSGTPLGVVDVIVTTPYGTSPNTVADNFTNTSSHTITTTLQGFFTLIGWVGIDNISVADALRGGPNGPTGGTNNITSLVSVVWGFNSATQTFQAYFPASANVPGANDLTAMHSGQGYFIGLVNPNSVVQWTYMLGA